MVLKKILAILLGLLYLSFAVVQYNDPDPVLWMIIYGLAALLTFFSAADKVAPVVLWIAAAFFAVGAVYMWPERFEGVSIGGGDIKNIEEARESLGLFLCAVSFAALALLDNYNMRRTLRMQRLQKKRWAR